MKTITEPPEPLTDDEKTQLLAYYMAESEAGRIDFRRPGRPRKGSTAVSLHELLGVTRQDICQWKKLAAAARTIGESEVMKPGPRDGTYTCLVKAGQRRPADNADTFEGTGLDVCARLLLLDAERYLEELSRERSRRDIKFVIRALRCRLRELALMWRDPAVPIKEQSIEPRDERRETRRPSVVIDELLKQVGLTL